MEAEIQRLAETAERLEREAAQLREAVAALAGARRERAEAGADDAEARLVAYSMVLDGRPREEVAAHLESELGFGAHGPLLDELYAAGD